MSDSHDAYENIRKALDYFVLESVSVVLHLGDIVAPTVYYDILQNYTDKLSFVLVFGNNDGEKAHWIQIAAKDTKIDLQGGDFREYEIDDKKVFMTHYPEIAELAALSSKYDAVFFGHTHQKSKSRVNNTWLVNPGETAAIRTGNLSVAVWDTDADDVQLIDL